MRDDHAGDVTVGVSSPADLAGDVMWHLRPCWGRHLRCGAPAVAGDITAGVASPAVAVAASLAEF